MKNTLKNIAFGICLAGILAGAIAYVYHDDRRLNDEYTAEILQIEKDLKKGTLPEQETIDRLYRWRNRVDEKYGCGGPTKEFIEAYDRVIKPL